MLRLIVLIIIVAIVLGFFGFNIRDIINSPTVQNNLQYLKDAGLYVWNHFLRPPVMWFWNTFGRYIWNLFMENMTRLKSGQPSTLQENAPSVTY